MRKIFPILFLLAAALPAFAEIVPMTRAKEEAEQFLQRVRPGRAPQLKLLSEGSKLARSAADAPEYYIFADEGGGFVIAAGDNTVPAILGYSTTSTFKTEGMPENLRGWLDMWERIVTGTRQSGAAPIQAPLQATGTRKELETALWNQGHPFNLQCIMMDDGRPVTGCTATAIAIAMRYHQWPVAGTGTLPSYSFSDGNTGKNYVVPAQDLGRPYAWDKMPLTKYSTSWTDEQNEEVSILMRDVGVMLQSHYSPSGTGAYLPNAVPTLAKFMGYDKSLYSDEKSLYDDVKDWVAVLKNNIDQFGPVLYAAYTSDVNAAGHAFILDGYDEYDNLRINWGWGGNSNGFFVMPSFNEYTEGHHAVLGLKRDEGGSAPDDLQIYNLGISSSASSFVVGKPFTMSCRSVANYGMDTFRGETAFAKFDRNGVMEELISEPDSLILNSYYILSLTDVACVVTTPIKAGDVIRLLYRSERTPEWTAVRYDHETMAIGVFPIGDMVILEDIVSVSYDAGTGILTVSFKDTASCELRLNGSPVTDGVTDKGDSVTIDAHQLAPATYTLHLQRGDQQRDISLKFGLK